MRCRYGNVACRLDETNTTSVFINTKLHMSPRCWPYDVHCHSTSATWCTTPLILSYSYVTLLFTMLVPASPCSFSRLRTWTIMLESALHDLFYEACQAYGFVVTMNCPGAYLGNLANYVVPQAKEFHGVAILYAWNSGHLLEQNSIFIYWLILLYNF